MKLLFIAADLGKEHWLGFSFLLRTFLALLVHFKFTFSDIVESIDLSSSEMKYEFS